MLSVDILRGKWENDARDGKLFINEFFVNAEFRKKILQNLAKLIESKLYKFTRIRTLNLKFKNVILNCEFKLKSVKM